MVIEHTKSIKDKDTLVQILGILTECNYEFVPPLTARNSTVQSDFKSIAPNDNKIPVAYFEMIQNQSFFIAKENGAAAGFMSYKENFTSCVISDKYLPNVYISTVIVGKEFRRQGLTKKLYDKLFEIHKDKYIFTRTWSANLPHTALLLKMNFNEFYRIPNDRGDGIDTVYYMKKCNNL